MFNKAKYLSWDRNTDTGIEGVSFGTAGGIIALINL